MVYSPVIGYKKEKANFTLYGKADAVCAWLALIALSAALGWFGVGLMLGV